MAKTHFFDSPQKNLGAMTGSSATPQLQKKEISYRVAHALLLMVGHARQQ